MQSLPYKMNTFHIHIKNTPVGDITIAERGGCLTCLCFGLACIGEYRRTALLDLCERQLWEYFAGQRRSFDLPLDMEGTAFRRRVWQALAGIPWGETATYSHIAARIGSPKAQRAVGGACRANPIPIIVPCHRVLGKNDIGGYAYGQDAKKTLLKIENLGNNY